MEKFTKGPWVVRGSEIGVVDRSNTQSFGMMNIIANMDKYDFKDQYKANAHLMVAAPDMYKEIEQDIEWLQRLSKDYVAGSHVLRSILLRIKTKKSLLSKARGE
tara:strand:- start:43322 stop:43633 length:312 start_codon:yes stop_codon:yes gene_type:complete